ncbi:hypothetical protein GALMADRAFT_240560 [Galerina marginata CBS 339.88]|uniref:Uncharacterized protein n=1 Tax=Galerina marginata (strain CBS 339.88) TaxID=685588 RepID=A0A067TQ93_GALM3|nr:hypothetical protein GALMADRAFT_240560 [Galerina marginata CBS 339.88]
MAVFPLNGSGPFVNGVDLLPLAYPPTSPKMFATQTDLPLPTNPPLQPGRDSSIMVLKSTLHLLLEEITDARDQLHAAIARQKHAVQTSRWRIGAYDSLLKMTCQEDGSNAGIPFSSSPGRGFPSGPFLHTPVLQSAGHQYSTNSARQDSAPDSDSDVAELLG